MPKQALPIVARTGSGSSEECERENAQDPRPDSRRMDQAEPPVKLAKQSSDHPKPPHRRRYRKAAPKGAALGRREFRIEEGDGAAGGARQYE